MGSTSAPLANEPDTLALVQPDVPDVVDEPDEVPPTCTAVAEEGIEDSEPGPDEAPAELAAPDEQATDRPTAQPARQSAARAGLLFAAGGFAVLVAAWAMAVEVGTSPSLERWDTLWFHLISSSGYLVHLPSTQQFDQGRPAYMPGYPVLLAGVQTVVPFPLSGLLITAVGLCLLPGLLVSYARAAGYRAVDGHRSAWLMLLSPVGFWLVVPYTELPYLLAAVPALTAAHRRRWLPAASLTCLAVLVRLTGLSLALGLAAAWLASELLPALRRRRLRVVLGVVPSGLLVALPPLVWLGWSNLVSAMVGVPDAIRWAERVNWGRHLDWPWHAVQSTVQMPGTGVPPLQLMEAASVLVGLLAAAGFLWRRRLPEAVYVGSAAGLLACQAYLASGQRGLLVWFPVWVAAAAGLPQLPARPRTVVQTAFAVVVVARLAVFLAGWRFLG